MNAQYTKPLQIGISSVKSKKLSQLGEVRIKFSRKVEHRNGGKKVKK